MKETTLWKSRIFRKYQHINVSFQPPAIERGFYTDISGKNDRVDKETNGDTNISTNKQCDGWVKGWIYSSHDMIMVVGDLNAKLGSNNIYRGGNGEI